MRRRNSPKKPTESTDPIVQTDPIMQTGSVVQTDPITAQNTSAKPSESSQSMQSVLRSLGANSGMDGRLYQVEFKGLLNPIHALMSSQLVRSSHQVLTVPHQRLSVEMKRILRVGGQIIRVTSVGI